MKKVSFLLTVLFACIQIFAQSEYKHKLGLKIVEPTRTVLNIANSVEVGIGINGLYRYHVWENLSLQGEIGVGVKNYSPSSKYSRKFSGGFVGVGVLGREYLGKSSTYLYCSVSLGFSFFKESGIINITPTYWNIYNLSNLVFEGDMTIKSVEPVVTFDLGFNISMSKRIHLNVGGQIAHIQSRSGMNIGGTYVREVKRTRYFPGFGEVYNDLRADLILAVMYSF